MPARETQRQVQILEKGDIVFLYRPRKGVTRPQGAQDVERVYLMLLPDKQDEHKNRVFGLPQGAFPSTTEPGETLAVAEEVGPDPRVVLDSFQEEGAGPAGQAILHWARAAGEGRYAIVRHHDHTHLAYGLYRPSQPGEVQDALRVAPEGNYLISVKAPHAPPELLQQARPAYPPRLGNRIAGYRTVAVDPTDFLDYRHSQIVLEGATGRGEQDLDVSLDAGHLNVARRQMLQMLHKEDRQAAR